MSKNSFTNSRPNLINDEIIKNIKNLSVNNENINVKSVEWTESLSNFYYAYIKPNVFGIIIIICIIIFLSYKYFSKNKKKEIKNKKEKITKEEVPKERVTAIETINEEKEPELNNDDIENILG